MKIDLKKIGEKSIEFVVDSIVNPSLIREEENEFVLKSRK